jgi:hypothetical protein
MTIHSQKFEAKTAEVADVPSDEILRAETQGEACAVWQHVSLFIKEW